MAPSALSVPQGVAQSVSLQHVDYGGRPRPARKFDQPEAGSKSAQSSELADIPYVAPIMTSDTFRRIASSHRDVGNRLRGQSRGQKIPPGGTPHNCASNFQPAAYHPAMVK